jgi:hypothetical protein
MSPTFTSGKLKGMLKPISGTVDNFLEHVEKIAGKEEDVNVKPLFQGDINLFNRYISRFLNVKKPL